MKKSLLIAAAAAATFWTGVASAANVGVYVGSGPTYYAPAPAPVIVEQRVYPSYVGGYYQVAPVYYHRGNRHDRNWGYWKKRDKHYRHYHDRYDRW